MHYFLFLIFTLGTSLLFGQVFSSPPENKPLGHEFISADRKSNDILETSYQNSTRAERIDIKQTILKGSYLSDNLNRSGRVIFTGEAVDYLNELKSKILANYPNIDSVIRVFVTDDASLNAFATVDNRIYVNVGLLARVQTEGQLVFILCHEIMHIINHHIIGVSENNKKDETSISKGEILHNVRIQELDRHLQSRMDEFEADLDGFGLFSKLDYHPSESLRTMELLVTAADPVLSPLPEARFFFLDSSQFSDVIFSFNPRIKTSELGDAGSRTHPAVADRWEVFDSIVIEKTNPTKIEPTALFLKIHGEAKQRIPSILAQDLDFIGLFQDASARYNNGDQSDKTIHSLCYAIQGMFVDKCKGFKSEDRYSPNRTDSLMNHFYKSSREKELACWSYLTLLSLQSNHEAVVTPFLKSLESNIVQMDSSDYKITLGNEFTPQTKTVSATALNFEDIEFTVSPYVDLTYKQFKKLKRREGQGNYEDGKIALLNTTAFQIRKERIFSLKFVLDLRKGENLTNRSREAFSNLAENREEVVCLTPYIHNYYSHEYETYKILNTWMNEYHYFDEYDYQSFHAQEIDSLMTTEGIRYVMSSLSVEVKSGSGKQFFLTYFSPFILPLYVPMLVVNTIIDGTRSYNLSIIVDLKTKSLVFWDKRTSNEPSTSALYYQNNDDVLNKFQARKKK